MQRLLLPVLLFGNSFLRVFAVLDFCETSQF